MPTESDARAQARGEHIMEQSSKIKDSSEGDTSSSVEEKKPMRLRDVSDE